jgi:hypothetical protein
MTDQGIGLTREALLQTLQPMRSALDTINRVCAAGVRLVAQAVHT